MIKIWGETKLYRAIVGVVVMIIIIIVERESRNEREGESAPKRRCDTLYDHKLYDT